MESTPQGALKDHNEGVQGSTSSPEVKVLTNPLILELLISNLEMTDEDAMDVGLAVNGILRPLRLVSRPFNDIILKSGRLVLNLDTEITGGPASFQDLAFHKTPIPIEEFSSGVAWDPKICSSVKATIFYLDGGYTNNLLPKKAEFEDDIVVGRRLLPVSLINLLRFTKVYGTHVHNLELESMTPDSYIPLAHCLPIHCPNLRRIKVGQAKTKDRYVQGEEENLPEEETFEAFPVWTSDKLTQVEVEAFDDCDISIKMLKTFMEGAPNVETLRIGSELLYVDLSDWKKLKSLHYLASTMHKKAFDCQATKETISSGLTLEHLELQIWVTLYAREDAREVIRRNEGGPLGSLPQLRTIAFKTGIGGKLRAPFGDFLCDCIFGRSMPALQSLIVDSLDDVAIGDWLVLIGENLGSHHNHSVRQFQLHGRVNDLNGLAFLQSAFPNLERLQLKQGLGNGTTRGGLQSLRVVINPLFLWTQLREVDLKIHFKMTMSDFGAMLQELGPQFWTHGNLRKFTLRLPLKRNLVRMDDDFQIAVLETSLYAMKAMDGVAFVNFDIPSVVKDRLNEVVSENGLPVEFRDNMDDNDYYVRGVDTKGWVLPSIRDTNILLNIRENRSENESTSDAEDSSGEEEEDEDEEVGEDVDDEDEDGGEEGVDDEDEDGAEEGVDDEDEEGGEAEGEGNDE